MEESLCFECVLPISSDSSEHLRKHETELKPCPAELTFWFMEKLTFMRLILVFQVNPSDYFSSCIRLQIICFLLIKIYKQEIKIFCYEDSWSNIYFQNKS